MPSKLQSCTRLFVVDYPMFIRTVIFADLRQIYLFMSHELIVNKPSAEVLILALHSRIGILAIGSNRYGAVSGSA